MNTVRVITGSLKGRKIPFSIEKFNNADITAQKVKGAIFSAIGEFIGGRVFVDLFAGSGQIGIEAFSRGAFTVINELDPKRHKFIKSFFDGLGIAKGFLLLNFHAERAVRYMSKNNIKADYIFLDPPYIKDRAGAFVYDEIISYISKGSVLQDDGMIIIQHYSKNHLSEESSDFILSQTKVYGATALSFYSKQ